MVKASQEQVFADVEGETILLNLSTGKYFSLNPVGSSIWELVQQPISIEQITDGIMEEYEVEKEHCRADVIRLIGKLLDAGLIDVLEEGIS